MKKRSISSQIICDTAKEMGLNIEIINTNKNLFMISDKNKKNLFKNIDCGINTSLSLKICDDKELTYNILERNGIETAQSVYIENINIDNFDYKSLNINYPIVVKPVNGAHGNGVYTNIRKDKELLEAIKKATKFSKDIIIQKHIEGDEHRILVIGDKVIYGIRRVPAYIISDGKHSIEELIIIENHNKLRGTGYDKPMTKIKIDNDLIEHIEKNYGYSIKTIPDNNIKVTLRGISNIGAGGHPEDVTNELGDEFKNECIKIAKSLGLSIAGIDIITNDLSIGLKESKGAVLEVGATPGFGGDIESTGINPAKYLLEFVFNKGEL